MPDKDGKQNDSGANECGLHQPIHFLPQGSVAADGVVGVLLGVVVEVDDGATARRGTRVVCVSDHRHSVIMLILV